MLCKDISVCYQAFDENTFALMKNDIKRKYCRKIRYFRKIRMK